MERDRQKAQFMYEEEEQQQLHLKQQQHQLQQQQHQQQPRYYNNQREPPMYSRVSNNSLRNVHSFLQARHENGFGTLPQKWDINHFYGDNDPRAFLGCG